MKAAEEIKEISGSTKRIIGSIETESDDARIDKPDLAESGSITPILKHNPKSLLKIGEKVHIKEYTYGKKDGKNFLKRFAINPKDTTEFIKNSIPEFELHNIEKDIFNFAREELNRSSSVLVDIFARKKVDPKDKDFVIKKISKSEYAETHTVCLWKPSRTEDKILLIDPSAASFSAFCKYISTLKEMKIEIYIPITKGRANEHSKFYSSELTVEDKRDCIDIAVKVGLQIINSTGKDEATIKEEIKLLSNQPTVNLGLTVATPIRELQSSDPTSRAEVLKLFKEIIPDQFDKKLDPTKLITISSLEELKQLHEKRENTKFQTKLKLVDGIGRIPLSKLSSIAKIVISGNTKLMKAGFPTQSLKISSTLSPDLKVMQEEFRDLVINHNTSDVRNWIDKFGSKEAELKKIIDEPDGWGQTALHWAAEIGCRHIAKSVLKQMSAPAVMRRAEGNNDYTAMHVAVIRGSVDVVELLVKKGWFMLLTDIDKDGWTPLHWACKKGEIEIARLLIEGMKALKLPLDQVTSHDKYTVLHIAVINAQDEVVEMLMKEIDSKILTATATYGRTALHFACRQGSKKIAELLIKEMKGQDLDQVTDPDKYTVLHLAVLDGDEKLVDLLLEVGSKELIEACDIRGWNALHIATFEGKTGIVKILLKKYPTLAKKGTEVVTALDLAKDEEIKKLFLIPEDSSKAKDGEDIKTLAIEAPTFDPSCIDTPALGIISHDD